MKSLAQHQQRAKREHQRRGMTSKPNLRKSSPLTWTLSRRKAVSQRMGRKRAGHREIRAHIDSDENGARDIRGYVGRLHRRACNQAGGQIVDEVRDEPHQQAGARRGECRRVPHSGAQRLAQDVNHTGPVEPFDKNKQPGDQGNNTPRNLAKKWPGRRSLYHRNADQRQDSSHTSWQPELPSQGRRASENQGGEYDAPPRRPSRKGQRCGWTSAWSGSVRAFRCVHFKMT